VEVEVDLGIEIMVVMIYTYLAGDLLESLSPFQRLLMLTGQDEIRQQRQHNDDGSNLQ